VALFCFIHPYAQGERNVLVGRVIVGAKVRDVPFAGSNICVDDLGQNVKSLMFGFPNGEGTFRDIEIESSKLVCTGEHKAHTPVGGY
jgi:hypothetical protein